MLPDDFIDKIRNKFMLSVKSTLKDNFEKDNNMFSLINEHFNFYIIVYAKGTMKNAMIFAEKIETNDEKIFINNIYEQTKNDLNTAKSHGNLNLFSYFLANDFLPSSINIEKINTHSLYSNYISNYEYLINTDLYAESWAAADFQESISTLSKKQFEISKFDSSILHYHEYNFTEMIDIVADEQFTGNLNQILSAYNQGWFYIAATGMGGLIEMLLYKTAINYNKPDFKRDKKDGLTKMNYAEKLRQLSKLTKNLPEDQKIHFESYDELTLDRDYLTRNAVSHFSTGFVNKKEVDSLFTALKNVYTRYFIPSTKYLEAHSELLEQN